MSEFIQVELTKAPRIEEITPNLTLETVPINKVESFELWSPKWTPKGAGLKPQEVELLKNDRLRVTRILSRLVWLMGAICIAEDDWSTGERQPLYDWNAVVEFVKREARCVNPIVTRVMFSTHAFLPIYDKDHKQRGLRPPQAWENSPPHWSVVFDDLVPDGEGFLLKQAENFVSVEIWTGKPVRRDVKNGHFYVEYNDIYAANRR